MEKEYKIEIYIHFLENIKKYRYYCEQMCNISNDDNIDVINI